MTKQDPNESYYKFINNDKYPIKPGVLPRDVRRIRSFAGRSFLVENFTTMTQQSEQFAEIFSYF